MREQWMKLEKQKEDDTGEDWSFAIHAPTIPLNRANWVPLTILPFPYLWLLEKTIREKENCEIGDNWRSYFGN